jgi:putative hydrolase of the HAD superfamily
MTPAFRVLFLDLDDTLYPSSTGLWEAIGERILKYMTEVAGIPLEQAPALRDEYFRSYGSTLAGLRRHQRIDPLEYLRYVHDLPLERYLNPDPEVRSMLASVSLRRVVFTNADRHHADRVLQRLALGSVIDQVIDIIDLEWVPKPLDDAYARALLLAGEEDPRACLILDDLARNVLPAQAMGMTGVVVGRKDLSPGPQYRIDSVGELPTVLLRLGVWPPRDTPKASP